MISATWDYKHEIKPIIKGNTEEMMAADCLLVRRQKLKQSKKLNTSGILNSNFGSHARAHARDSQTGKLLP